MEKLINELKSAVVELETIALGLRTPLNTANVTKAADAVFAEFSKTAVIKPVDTFKK